MQRRTFIQRSTLAGLGLATAPYWATRQQDPSLVQPITSGKRQHWFGYYDKWQIDPSGRYALGMEVDLFLRSPIPADIVKIGLINLENNNQWTEIGQSST